MTDEQFRERFTPDLIRMSGGEAPIAVHRYADGWSATFPSEIAALRVANHYANAKRVKPAPNVNGWTCGV